MNNEYLTLIPPEKDKATIKNVIEKDSQSLAMYEISGHQSIGQHPFKRYLDDDKRWGDRIRAIADNRLRLKGSVYRIEYAPDNEKAELIRQALNHPHTDIQEMAAKMIRYAPPNQRAGLIHETLNNLNTEAQQAAAEMIKYTPPNQRAELVREALNNSNVEVQKIAASVIWYVPDHEQAQLRQMLTDKIRIALSNSNPEIQQAAAWMIGSTLGDRAELVREALNNSNVEVQKIAAWMIGSTLDHEQAQLRQMLTDKIRQALNNLDIDARQAAEMIVYALDQKQTELRQMVTDKIRTALNSPNIEVQKIAAEMIEYALDSDKTQLSQLAIKKIGDLLIEPPLYNIGDFDKTHFSRKKFPKTGSETTLVGGDLKDKVIVRHIQPEHFLIWKALFEDYEFWQQEGFDYVPIEPIVAYRLEKNGKVAVFSGILDLSLYTWQRISPLFAQELENQRDKILQILEKKKVKHGHTHDRNFCLRFWRGKDGHADFTKVPRLYLIDFDQAVSPPRLFNKTAKKIIVETSRGSVK